MKTTFTLALSLFAVVMAQAGTLICQGVNVGNDECNFSNSNCSTFAVTSLVPGPVTPAAPSYQTVPVLSVSCLNCGGVAKKVCETRKYKKAAAYTLHTSASGVNSNSIAGSLNGSVRGMLGITLSGTSGATASYGWTYDVSDSEKMSLSIEISAPANRKTYYFRTLRIPSGSFQQTSNVGWKISHRDSCWAWDNTYTYKTGTDAILATSNGSGPGAEDIKDNTLVCTGD